MFNIWLASLFYQINMFLPLCSEKKYHHSKWLDATSDCFLFYCFFSAHKHYQPVMPDDSFRELVAAKMPCGYSDGEK